MKIALTKKHKTMKRKSALLFFIITIFTLFSLSFVLVNCTSEDHSIPEYTYDDEDDEKDVELYDWEKSRQSILASTDMVLLYGGGHQRIPFHWEKDRLESYVTYIDTDNKEHWLFDSFLFLEIFDLESGKTTKMFTQGYNFDAANKEDWTNLIEYYFTSGAGIVALDATIKAASGALGAPKTKRQVVISIPEPIVRLNPNNLSSPSNYWGEIDGLALDFINTKDRVKACKWYINEVRRKFDEGNFQNVELAGFYWLAEDASSSHAILNSVASYLDKMKYSFNWIPFFNAEGRTQWKSFGFDYSYYQPNYFFSNDVPDSRLDAACKEALEYDMHMEIEFDHDALVSGGKDYKLRNYMKAFKDYGIWEKKRLAYYQGEASLLALKGSGNVEDNKLFHEFCQFVISRPIRDAE